MKYRIGSFNMKNFGANSRKDMDKIAEIILGEDLDVIALQEILSEGKGVQRLLDQCLKHTRWDFCCASPYESSDPEKISDMIVNDSRGECYAYLWEKSKFKLMEYSRLGEKRIFEPRIINSMSNDVHTNCSFFARTPYYIRLQPLCGGFWELRLIDIHIYYGDGTLTSVAKRKLEFDVLTQEIYPQISQKRYGQNRVAYTVALGDYNLNLISPYTQPQTKNCFVSNNYSYYERNKEIRILTVQDQLTTLKDPARAYADENSFGETDRYANNYDHFTYSPELSGFTKVSFETVDAVNKYCGGDFSYYYQNISDHLPIIMTVEI